MKNWFKRKKIEAGEEDKPRQTVIDGKPIENIVEWGRNLLGEAQRHRDWAFSKDAGIIGSNFREEMQDRLKMYLGKHWDLVTTYQDSDDYDVENFLFPVVEIQLAIMLATRPQISFRPQGAEDVRLIDAVDQVVKKEQDKAGYDEYLTGKARYAKIFGFSIGCVEYSMIENPPIGSHVVRVCDPLGIFWQQRKTSLRGHNATKYLIEVRVRDLADVEQEWEVELPEEEGLLTNVREYSLADYMRDLLDDGKSLVPQVLQTDIWYRDKTIDKEQTKREPVMIEDEDSEQVQARGPNNELLFDVQQFLKYPKTRRIVLVGNHLLFDGENPYDHGMIPYTLTPNHKVPTYFEGMSEFHQLWGLNKSINALITAQRVNAELTGNNQREWFPGALNKGKDQTEITNEPGALFARSKADVPIIYPVEQGQITGQVDRLYDKKVKTIETISGATEISRGIAKASDSGIKVQSLDAYATRRMQNPTRNLEWSCKDEGLMLLKNSIQFLPPETIWRIANIKNAEDLGLQSIGETGEYQVSLAQLTEAIPPDIELDCIVTPMASLPSDRDAKLEMLVKLREIMPELAPEILCEFVDIPELAEKYLKWKEEQGDVGQLMENPLFQALLQRSPELQQIVAQLAEGAEGAEPQTAEGTPQI